MDNTPLVRVNVVCAPFMKSVIAAYEWLIISRPRLTLAALFLTVGFFAWYAPDFRLDASSDTLLLENDRDLRYFRGISARYGSLSFLVITYTASDSLFSDASIQDIKALRGELQAIDGVESVTTMLDVPLVNSPRTSLKELQTEVPNLLSERTDMDLARVELTQGPIYRELIMSRDGRTTAVLVTFRSDPEYLALIEQRDVLREKALSVDLSSAERAEIDELSFQIGERRAVLTDNERADIARIREILKYYEGGAELHIGGLPMIVADMLDFILKDVVVFGTGIVIFMAGLLSTFFIRPRWVLLSLACCLFSVVFMAGYLGMVSWPVTVVSANFVALLLIFSLSLTVHLIVRYRELHAQNPSANQGWLVGTTLRDKFQPCLFTSVTTMVAFASLLVTGIRPVIDFGWMMLIGMVVVLVIAFTLFPAGLMLLKPGIPQRRRDFTGAITGYCARLVQRRQAGVGIFYLVVALLGAVGITQLTVENRFIDNFKDTTEIYQGLVTIDRELGGTTPLDIILDADPAFFEDTTAEEPASMDAEFEDEFEDETDEEFAVDETDLGSTSYWYNTFRLQTVDEVHQYLDGLPETGKVLSMATTMETLRTINEDEKLSTFFLSVLYKKLPETVKDALFDPYMSSDGNQMRLTVRVFESDPNLRRAELIEKIRSHLVNEMGFKPEQVHLTGMLVLYNNVLQSLYRSQILTLGFVFLAILFMFMVLFRSPRIALIALVPNMVVAGSVLGIMGIFSVPLDIMTITIAAITVGIGVDDSIHYVHRFRQEFQRDGDYLAAVMRSHGSIGRAMYYTSIIIAAGFSILALSNFIPTIYFGVFTAFAMLFAMIANLTLLPLLLIWFRAMD
jgi:predicted RND superfamily exporter protein